MWCAALLGILLMNILVFGLPFAAYANPNLWGGNDALNLGVLAVQGSGRATSCTPTVCSGCCLPMRNVSPRKLLVTAGVALLLLSGMGTAQSVMRRFRFGPLEWCWRSLTYWRRQPMRRAVPEARAD